MPLYRVINKNIKEEIGMLKITKYGIIRLEEKCVNIRYENATSQNGHLTSFTKIEDYSVMETPVLIWNREKYYLAKGLV